MKKQIIRKGASYDFFGKLGIFASSLLVSASAVYLYSPVIGSHAAESATTVIRTNVGSVISLSASSDSVDMSANVNSFVHDTVDLTVVTNSQYGYSLTIEDADASSDMTHEDSSITDVITSNYSGSKTSGTMANNTWGFSVDSGTTYYRVPELNSPTYVGYKYGVVPNGTATNTIDFGVKIGVITSGIYSDTVLFTAYTNGTGGYPESGAGGSRRGVVADGVMQTFSCSNATAGTVYHLKDSRDNNIYDVLKAADGKCWMIENLRISNRTITSADSDLPSGASLMIRESIDLGGVDYINEQIQRENPSATEAQLADIFSTYGVYIDGANGYGGYYTPYTLVGGASNGLGNASGGKVNTSICPKNWKLPSGADVEALGGAYNNDYSKMVGSPINLQLTGGYFITEVSGTYKIVPNEVGTVGHLALSDFDLSQNKPLQILHFEANDIHLEDSVDFGSYTVRCVAR